MVYHLMLIFGCCPRVTYTRKHKHTLKSIKPYFVYLKQLQETTACIFKQDKIIKIRMIVLSKVYVINTRVSFLYMNVINNDFNYFFILTNKGKKISRRKCNDQPLHFLPFWYIIFHPLFRNTSFITIYCLISLLFAYPCRKRASRKEQDRGKDFNFVLKFLKLKL